MQISNHAYKRLHERSGLNRKASARLAERVLERGYRTYQLHGRLGKWVKERSEKDTCCDCIVYGDKLFIFKGKRTVLVTVIQIPSSLTKNMKEYISI